MDPRKVYAIKFSLFLTTVFVSSNAHDASELKFLIVVFNSGARSPLSTFAKDINQESAWPQGYGYLTQKGMQAQYELGQHLRKRYNGYLNEIYFAKEVYIQSLDLDRSLMSASVLLSGLYPPVESQIWSTDILWQPIPVHTKPLDQDPFLAPCPALDVLWNETLHSDEVQEFLRRYSLFKMAMETVLGSNVSSIFELEYAFDALACEREQGLTLNDWPANLSMIYLEEIYPFYQLVYHNATKVKRLVSGQLVNEVVRFFSLRQQEILDSRLKAYFLSANEKVIRSLLIGLDVYNFMMIPFSTAILLELKQSKEHGFVVNILLKNETEDPIPLTIPGCDYNCPMELFFNLTKDVISENWNLECYQFEGLVFVKIAQSVLLTTVVSVSVVIVFICGFAICCRKRFRKHIPKKYAALRAERMNAFPEEMPMMNASTVSSDLED